LEVGVTTIAVIGDIGGHRTHLRQAIAALGTSPLTTTLLSGADPPEIPADLTIVQVGDLIDRGPDSPGVLRDVDWYLRHQPDQWIQLIGNHETQYLPGRPRFWHEHLPPEDAKLLRGWWESGTMGVAAGVLAEAGEEMLITHAGLTCHAWWELGHPTSAAQAASWLNGRPEPLIWQSRMIAIDRYAGPIWAEAGWELYLPWLEYDQQGGLVPFHQAHGHSSIVQYQRRGWRAPGRVQRRASVDWSARLTQVRIGGRIFHGVDPKHDYQGAAQWKPLLLPGATLLAAPLLSAG
jgi:hypothetical protein